MNKEIIIPDIGSDEFEVIEIMVKVNDYVNINQPLITIEGSKTSIEIPSPEKGVIKEIKVNIGDKIFKNAVIMTIENTDSILDKKEKLIPLKKRKNKNDSIEKNLKKNIDIHASPLIRRLARKFEIDLKKVSGSGKHNRILKEDLYFFMKESEKKNKNNINRVSLDSEFNFSKFGEIEKISLGNIQKISGKNLIRNWNTIPHVTIHDEVDITEMENFRCKKNKEFAIKKLNFNITPIVFILKIISKALTHFPKFNSSLIEKNILILKKYINIGIAVDTSKGLLVPVIKNVDQKNIIKLSKELLIQANKARNENLKITDLQGGCFTISSLGKIGGNYFTPIINAPEVAILGISKSTFKPIWNSKKFAPRLMLPLSLSFDHRVIDGAEAARFMCYIKNIIRDIRNLIL